MRKNICDATRLRSNQHNGDFAICQVQLIPNAFIESDEHIKISLRQLQQLAIRRPGETSFGNCRAFVPLYG